MDYQTLFKNIILNNSSHQHGIFDALLKDNKLTSPLLKSFSTKDDILDQDAFSRHLNTLEFSVLLTELIAFARLYNHVGMAASLEFILERYEKDVKVIPNHTLNAYENHLKGCTSQEELLRSQLIQATLRGDAFQKQYESAKETIAKLQETNQLIMTYAQNAQQM